MGFLNILKGYVSPTRIGQPALRMPKKSPPPPRKYMRELVLYFVTWKLLLLAVAYASPGPGYDTSTALVLDRDAVQPYTVLDTLLLRLTRWDALYFTSSSHRGHVYEQEWAFSWALSRVTSVISNIFPPSLSPSPVIRHALVGVVVSHVSHLGAVLSLYALVRDLMPARAEQKRQIAFTTARLHVLSPAGLFLSAPYGESTFALLSFLGIWSYVHGLRRRHATIIQSPVGENAWMAAAGLSFGLSAMVRSNGLFWGIVFAWDAIASWIRLLSGRQSAELIKLLGIATGGILTGLGFIAPQVVAYQEYCTGRNSRPWCDRAMPSIYSWVQAHYWDVGFMKYWTLSNLPLFLLAAPMILLLLDTGYSALHHSRAILLAVNGEETPSQRNSADHQAQVRVFEDVMERLALPQMLIALLAFTSFHVQIINRISSGYPIWYLLLAIAMLHKSSSLACGHSTAEHYVPFRRLASLNGKTKEWVVRAMIMYAIVQGGLYASFMPPA